MSKTPQNKNKGAPRYIYIYIFDYLLEHFGRISTLNCVVFHRNLHYKFISELSKEDIVLGCHSFPSIYIYICTCQMLSFFFFFLSQMLSFCHLFLSLKYWALGFKGPVKQKLQKPEKTESCHHNFSQVEEKKHHITNASKLAIKQAHCLWRACNFLNRQIRVIFLIKTAKINFPHVLSLSQLIINTKIFGTSKQVGS